ncbi:hypothetical protein P7C70_g4218, partial [Phenoliferia sp. Uapishka_3]
MEYFDSKGLFRRLGEVVPLTLEELTIYGDFKSPKWCGKLLGMVMFRTLPQLKRLDVPRIGRRDFRLEDQEGDGLELLEISAAPTMELEPEEAQLECASTGNIKTDVELSLASTLPYEILTEIFGYNTPHVPLSPLASQAPLFDHALVCQNWYGPATRALYRTVCLKSSAQAARWIASAWRHRSKVRQLRVLETVGVMVKPVLSTTYPHLEYLAAPAYVGYKAVRKYIHRDIPRLALFVTANFPPTIKPLECQVQSLTITVGGIQKLEDRTLNSIVGSSIESLVELRIKLEAFDSRIGASALDNILTQTILPNVTSLSLVNIHHDYEFPKFSFNFPSLAVLRLQSTQRRLRGTSNINLFFSSLSEAMPLRLRVLSIELGNHDFKDWNTTLLETLQLTVFSGLRRLELPRVRKQELGFKLLGKLMERIGLAANTANFAGEDAVAEEGTMRDAYEDEEVENKLGMELL